MTITPDTKDWTWVLEKACPECGFDTALVPADRVAELTRASITRWQEVLRRPDASIRTEPDRWSALEYGCHVRDVFRIFDGRLHRMLSEDDPLFENWDQDVTAIEDRYAEQDPSQVAGALSANGAALAGRFDAVASDDLARPGRRSDGARFTVESFARYFIHDPIHHLYDVGAPLGAGRG